MRSRYNKPLTIRARWPKPGKTLYFNIYTADNAPSIYQFSEHWSRPSAVSEKSNFSDSIHPLYRVNIKFKKRA